MKAAQILNELGVQGFSFSLVADGGLLVRPFSTLRDNQRELLRAHKAEIVAFLSQGAANDPASSEPPMQDKLQAPAVDVPDWRELDKAYQAHHFKCSTCIAAGLGYGLRCGTGAALWTSYKNT